MFTEVIIAILTLIIAVVAHGVIKMKTRVHYEDFAGEITAEKCGYDKKKEAGFYGEKRICDEINKVACYKTGVFNTYLFSADNKYSTEIDAIFIMKSGIFIFESKNYTGSIKGRYNEKMWGKRKGPFEKWSYDFYNPILQNEGHIKALKKHLDMENYQNLQIFSIVAFNDKARLKIKGKAKDKSCYVIHYKDVKFFIIRQNIKSFLRKTRIDKVSLNKLEIKLVSKNLRNQRYSEIHLENVKKMRMRWRKKESA